MKDRVYPWANNGLRSDFANFIQWFYGVHEVDLSNHPVRLSLAVYEMAMRLIDQNITTAQAEVIKTWADNPVSGTP